MVNSNLVIFLIFKFFIDSQSSLVDSLGVGAYLRIDLRSSRGTHLSGTIPRRCPSNINSCTAIKFVATHLQLCMYQFAYNLHIFRGKKSHSYLFSVEYTQHMSMTRPKKIHSSKQQDTVRVRVI